MLQPARFLVATTLIAAVFSGSGLGAAQPAHAAKSHFNCNGNKGSTNCQSGLININFTGVTSDDNDFNVTLVKMGDALSNLDIDVVNLDVKTTDVIKAHLEKNGIQVCGIKVQVGLKNLDKTYC